MRLTCNQEKSVRIWYGAQKKTFFDILALNCPVDELAKSPHFECGVWKFDPSRDNYMVYEDKLVESPLCESGDSGFKSHHIP